MMLSILICSLYSRAHLLAELKAILQPQITSDVELLIEVDNKEISTGAKRNILLNRAKGKYIVFIDDDDIVSENYVDKILEACKHDVDCIAINGTITTNGMNEIAWRLSKSNPNSSIYENGKEIYLRTTNHIAPVKRELALIALFPNISNAEDAEYSRRLNKFLKTETIILEPIYHYRYLTYNKEYLR
jgi:glycosyltransferase involved in cell wall biosynthesis